MLLDALAKVPFTLDLFYFVYQVTCEHILATGQRLQETSDGDLMALQILVMPVTDPYTLNHVEVDTHIP